ncbi:transposase [Candidatus Saccharibacteria bacterium]|nr:MAG: transposase [Candidatus Saccharibacteria bacterium]
MPGKNSRKIYSSEHYYHVYNRGVGKQIIFHDSFDKSHFLHIIKRHLDPTDKSTRSDKLPYRKFNDDIELLSYCLMGNHFHLLLYVKGRAENLPIFIQSVMTAYTMHYNKRYKRVGSLFQGVYKASMILDESYLLHITRYIHLNPRNYQNYFYSSLRYYLDGSICPKWLNPKRILEMFEKEEYKIFVEDRLSYEESLPILKKFELAHP